MEYRNCANKKRKRKNWRSRQEETEKSERRNGKLSRFGLQDSQKSFDFKRVGKPAVGLKPVESGCA